MPWVIQSEIRTTTVILGGAIHRVDTIDYENKLWLVPNWLDTPDGKWTMPARLIHPEQQAFLPFGPDAFVLSHPLPKELFEMRPLKQPIDGYAVQELPDIGLARTQGN